MRRLMTASAFLTFAACGQPPAEPPAPPTAETSATPGLPAAPTPAPVEGWETDVITYSKIGAQLPAFTAWGDELTEFTAENLRGRWTIVSVITAPLPQEETSYLAALASAANQDPDLDVLMVDPKPGPTTWPGDKYVISGWPVVTNASRLVTALGLPASPAYLLIGPDLTIEAYRGALSSSPEDGIKPVIRGVAEIRKQVAAPQ